MIDTKYQQILQNISLSLFLAFWRYLFCYEYVHVTIEDMVSFQAPMPFASRVLLPGVGRLIEIATGIDPQVVFLLTDFLSSFALFALFSQILSRYSFSSRASLVARCVIGVYIALLYAGLSTLRIYYPWDVPSATFVLLSILLVQQGRYLLFMILLPVAILNRETAALLPLIYFGIATVPLLKRTLVTGLLLLVSLLIEYFVQTQVAPRGTGEVVSLLDYSNRLSANAQFMVEQPLLFALVALPVPLYWIFVGLWRSNDGLKGLVYVSLGLYLMAFVFGNAYEPRVFVEAVVASAVPIACWYRDLRGCTA